MVAPIRRMVVTGLVVIAIREGRKVTDAMETSEMIRMNAIGGFVGSKTVRAASKIEMAESIGVLAVQDAAEEVAEAEAAEIDLGTETMSGKKETSGKFMCSLEASSILLMQDTS